MEKKERRKDQGAIHSIVNNLHSAKGSTLGGAQMKFYVSRLKELSGMSEQSLIMRMLWYAFDNDKRHDPYRAQLTDEWSRKKDV